MSQSEHASARRHQHVPDQNPPRQRHIRRGSGPESQSSRRGRRASLRRSSTGGRQVYRELAERTRNLVETHKPSLVHVMYGGVMASIVTRAVPDRPVLVSFHGSDLLGTSRNGVIGTLSWRYGILSTMIPAARVAARRAGEGSGNAAHHGLTCPHPRAGSASAERKTHITKVPVRFPGPGQYRSRPQPLRTRWFHVGPRQ
jgi:hypothetical protein